MAAAPSLGPIRVDLVDGSARPTRPVVEVPFYVIVTYRYENGTDEYYRVCASVEGTRFYSDPVNYMVPDGSAEFRVPIRVTASRAGTWTLNVKVDCDDTIAGADVLPKSADYPITVDLGDPPVLRPTGIEIRGSAPALKPVVAAAGTPFWILVSYSYANAVTNAYRVSVSVGGNVFYSPPVDWGKGTKNFASLIYVGAMVPHAGTFPLTVKVDSDDAVTPADDVAKSRTWDLVVYPSVPSFDFSGWQPFFESRVPNDGAGGFAWLGLEDGNVVARGSMGYARAPWEPVNPSVPFTTSDPMHLASISKLFAWIGLGKLWESKRGTAGQFEYDDRVVPYLRPLVPNIHPSFESLTFSHVASHRTGLTNGFGDLESMRAALALPAAWPPGTEYSYSNQNYYLLSFLIQIIARQPYRDFIQQRVLWPLGMTNTSDNPASPAPVLAYGRAADRTPGFLMTVPPGGLSGAAGWWSSAEDLAKLLVGLREGANLQPATREKVGLSGGRWVWNGAWMAGANGTAGNIAACVYRLGEHIDAVMLVNSEKGTDPHDGYLASPENLLADAFALPQSRLPLTVRGDGAGIECAFRAFAGRSYTVESSTDLAEHEWFTVTSVAGSNDVQRVRIPFSSAHEFVRVRED